jgi:MFS family permease
MHRPPVTQLPPPLAVAKVPFGRLMRGDLAGVVGLLTVAYLLLVTVFYYVAAWVPQVARDMGGTPTDVANLAALISGSGVVATIAVGLLAHPVGLHRLALVVVVAAAVAVGCLGQMPADLATFSIAAAVAGFFVFGSFTGIYALIVQSFPADVRATACGVVVGVGRVGSVTSPILVGALFGAGFDTGFICSLMAGFALLAAFAIIGLHLVRGRPTPALARV